MREKSALRPTSLYSCNRTLANIPCVSLSSLAAIAWEAVGVAHSDGAVPPPTSCKGRISGVRVSAGRVAGADGAGGTTGTMSLHCVPPSPGFFRCLLFKTQSQHPWSQCLLRVSCINQHNVLDFLSAFGLEIAIAHRPQLELQAQITQTRSPNDCWPFLLLVCPTPLSLGEKRALWREKSDLALQERILKIRHFQLIVCVFLRSNLATQDQILK